MNMISDEAIRRRSYAIWEQEGRPDGKAMEHWLRAKTELELESGGALSRSTDWTVTVMPRVPISCPPTRMLSKRVAKIDTAVAA